MSKSQSLQLKPFHEVKGTFADPHTLIDYKITLSP